MIYIKPNNTRNENDEAGKGQWRATAKRVGEGRKRERERGRERGRKRGKERERGMTEGKSEGGGGGERRR